MNMILSLFHICCFVHGFLCYNLKYVPLYNVYLFGKYLIIKYKSYRKKKNYLANKNIFVSCGI